MTPRPSRFTSWQSRSTSLEVDRLAAREKHAQRDSFGQGHAIVFQRQRRLQRRGGIEQPASDDGGDFAQAVAERELRPAIIDAEEFSQQFELGVLHADQQGHGIPVGGERSLFAPPHSIHEIDGPMEQVGGDGRYAPQVAFDGVPVGGVGQQFGRPAQVRDVVAAKRARTVVGSRRLRGRLGIADDR